MHTDAYSLVYCLMQVYCTGFRGGVKVDTLHDFVPLPGSAMLRAECAGLANHPQTNFALSPLFPSFSHVWFDSASSIFRVFQRSNMISFFHTSTKQASFDFQQPYAHAAYFSRLATYIPEYPVEELRAATKRVTLEQVRNFSALLRAKEQSFFGQAELSAGDGGRLTCGDEIIQTWCMNLMTLDVQV